MKMSFKPEIEHQSKKMLDSEFLCVFSCGPTVNLCTHYITEINSLSLNKKKYGFR